MLQQLNNLTFIIDCSAGWPRLLAQS